jgi:hypothetical protein
MVKGYLIWMIGGMLGVLLGLPMLSSTGAGAAGGPMAAVVHVGRGLTIAGPAGETSVALSVDVSVRTGGVYFLALPPFTARDTSGTGRGWHVAIQALPFRGAGGASLPSGSLSVAGPSARCADGISCRGRAAPPVVTGRYPAAIDTPAAVTLLSAGPATGMGAYVLNPGNFGSSRGHNLRLAVPSGAAATQYKSTLMISIVPGA